jgi:hypothetical protein
MDASKSVWKAFNYPTRLTTKSDSLIKARLSTTNDWARSFEPLRSSKRNAMTEQFTGHRLHIERMAHPSQRTKLPAPKDRETSQPQSRL